MLFGKYTVAPEPAYRNIPTSYWQALAEAGAMVNSTIRDSHFHRLGGGAEQASEDCEVSL